jgi:CspA family cold shock protein
VRAGACFSADRSPIWRFLASSSNRQPTEQYFNEGTMATMNGTIKRLTDKGFGFIAASDGSEFFFHHSACSQTRFEELREGQPVTFERGQGPKGPRAENVRVAG